MVVVKTDFCRNPELESSADTSGQRDRSTVQHEASAGAGGSCQQNTTHVILREVLKLRADVAGLHEIIEALQRQMGQQQAAPIEASRTSNHFPFSSREELDALKARLMDGEHRSELVRQIDGLGCGQAIKKLAAPGFLLA
ncbi:hypothetical protein ISCGN_001532 [Ixodes scapularis]